jgi:hypothetical protein
MKSASWISINCTFNSFSGGLKRFLKEYDKNTHILGAVFVQNLEWPGRFYQIIWKCNSEEQAIKIFDTIKGKGTLLGVYLNVHFLYEIKEDEYKILKKQHID